MQSSLTCTCFDVAANKNPHNFSGRARDTGNLKHKTIFDSQDDERNALPNFRRWLTTSSRVKMLRNISTFRIQLPDFLSYHLPNARNGSLRTTYIIPPPPPLPKELAPSASFGPSHRWIASLHNKKPGYEPVDCMLLVMAFGRSILCPGSCKVS